MKMTQENMKRFDEMVKDFANSNNLFVKIDQEFNLGRTEVEFKLLEQNGRLRTSIYWETKKSLTDACTALFTLVIRQWNLDGGEVPAAVPEIKNVIFNDPATIVLWEDGTKTIVKCQDGDTYSEELGLAMCIAKKALGNKGNFNEVFKKWLPVESAYPSVQTAPVTDRPMSQAFKRFLIESIEDVLNNSLKKGCVLE